MRESFGLFDVNRKIVFALKERVFRVEMNDGQVEEGCKRK